MDKLFYDMNTTMKIPTRKSFLFSAFYNIAS